jgi:phage-related protein
VQRLEIAGDRIGMRRRNDRQRPGLQLIQFGGMPKDAKPFKGIGSGVIEIALRHATEAYRTVVAVQLGKKVYVLHAFQKKSTKGIATPKQDVDLIRQRYAEAKEHARSEE